ncbi:hypothetical protein [Cellulosimicrobium composti]|uniref:SAF domain-containing protein n=1 Tax=Cellulosimicrobium composti TaxID=2672572 RepID=A0ABX0BH57_9MICO|nr:hypothetical protein [Cellulosimicrobium composti]NDO91327.1 hypothetical protein [Cellulosimicrobium composti]TWG87735.1 hypothetical protein L603_000100000940 [Cellulosimicrobium cellulans J34]SME96803.1 hypothetical protein SAMN02744115_00616 [Cellulosimicrobium cellulans J1]
MTTTVERPVRAVPEPAPAARLRRPGWRDPRLLVGVVVVALSVALGSWAVSSAARTVDVYAAGTALTPGTPVTAADLRTVEVRLGAQTDRYVLVEDGLPDEAVVLRTVAPGELVPAAALGAAADLAVRAVAVPVSTGLSDRIVAGAAVDVWHVPAEAGAAPGGDPVAETAEPQLLVSGVTVAEVDEGSGTLVVGGPVTVHLLVGADDLPGVLAAVAGDGTIALVPVGSAG